MKKTVAVRKGKKAGVRTIVNPEKALILHPEIRKQTLKAKIKLEAEKKAYELFEKNGRAHGNDLAHWLEAERELIRQHVWQLI
ncbi:MAG: hypothetical protein A2231_01380 [Candidatus Firestonebacteria bacterium RIFOXYA2_FULL_40_8]|nr:MAG: hypothetical protein A2231_01380 [Candidatus Firestonebacteria bacterium RIFOXYA2_FULL_40_8]